MYRAVTSLPERTRGYTLVELSITILVVGVLAGYAVPGFRDLLASVRYNRSADNVVDTLEMARNQAIFSGRGAVICASDDIEATQPSCRADQGDWSEGWIVFEDCNGDGVRQDSTNVCDNNDDSILDAPERVFKTFRPGLVMTSDVDGPIQFSAQGRVNQNLEFTVFAYDGQGKIGISAPARIQASFEYSSP